METHFEHIRVYNFTCGLCGETQPSSSSIMKGNRETHARFYASGLKQVGTRTPTQYIQDNILCRVRWCSCQSVPGFCRKKWLLQSWFRRANRGSTKNNYRGNMTSPKFWTSNKCRIGSCLPAIQTLSFDRMQTDEVHQSQSGKPTESFALVSCAACVVLAKDLRAKHGIFL